MAEGRGQTVQIQPPSVRAETLNVLKAAAAIVVIVAAYIFRPSFGDARDRQSRRSPIGLLPYQKLIRDAPPERAAHVPRAAGRAARSRADPRADRPLAGRDVPSRPKAFRRSLAIPRRKSPTTGRRSGRTGRPITSACRQIRRSPRGCSSSSSPSPARPPIRRRTTKRITGCLTGRRCTCRSGICRKRNGAAVSPRSGCRRTKAGRTGWWGQMRNKDRCLDTETQRHTEDAQRKCISLRAASVGSVATRRVRRPRSGRPGEKRQTQTQDGRELGRSCVLRLSSLARPPCGANSTRRPCLCVEISVLRLVLVALLQSHMRKRRSPLRR